jgi:hypothetical protein
MRTIHADYHETDGDEISFRFTVQANDRASDGLSVWGNAIKLNGGSIRDSDDNDAVLTNSATGPDSGHTVNGSKAGEGNTVDMDNTAPTVSSVSFTSTPTETMYAQGDSVQVSVTFGEDVQVTGTPRIALSIGALTRHAEYDSHDGNTVLFAYEVQTGDADDDGISIAANSIALNGGSITDKAGNDADLSHVAVDGGTAQASDGRDITGPEITRIKFTSDPGADDHYGLGDVIEATVTFNEPITVTAGPDDACPTWSSASTPCPATAGSARS